MNGLRVAPLLLLLAGVTAAQEGAPSAAVPKAPQPDEVICYEKKNFQGESFTVKVGDALPDLKKTEFGNWELRISSLKVGDEAVAVLFSSPGFSRFCLGLPGKVLHGAGYYPDLDKVKNPDLRTTLDDWTRSLRVVGKDADLATVCRATKKAAPAVKGRL